MDETHRITFDQDRCGGRPTLRGLRIRVADILDLLSVGGTRAEILEDYPFLQDGDITAALQYAADTARIGWGAGSPSAPRTP